MHSTVSPAPGRWLVCLLALALMPSTAAAQYETVPRPAAYALENVTVVHADGRQQPGVTVVVRGDLIAAMGRDVTVPPDAERLEGDSLMIYPGFVDGQGTGDYEFPDPDIDRDRVELWNAPRVLQGFTPSREVVEHLTSTGDDVDGPLEEGIVAGAVHPARGMMAGRGTLLLYKPNAETPAGLVIDPVLGPIFRFQGGRGVYPGTLFGVTAFIRQALEDARHRAAVAAAHERRPSGLATPTHDPDYAALQEVLDGDAPVYFVADEAAAILRALKLADAYDLDVVIVGGAEAWRVADQLRERDVPVLVSTDFGEPRRWDPPDRASSEPEGEATTGEPAGAGELDAQEQREQREFEDRWSNAGRLAESGVVFALTSGGSGEVLEGARKAVAYGLDADAALAALTSTPAALFGVPHLVRVEAGLPATFVVTDGPIFDAETRVLHTFVEGYRQEVGMAGSGAEAGSAEEAVDLAGTWEMSLDAEGQQMSARLVVEQDGATFTGTMSLMGQELRLRDGVINGNEMSVVAELEQGGETLDVEITGTVEGDTASGEADAGPMGVARWTAKRVGPGGAR